MEPRRFWLLVPTKVPDTDALTQSLVRLSVRRPPARSKSELTSLGNLKEAVIGNATSKGGNLVDRFFLAVCDAGA